MYLRGWYSYCSHFTDEETKASLHMLTLARWWAVEASRAGQAVCPQGVCTLTHNVWFFVFGHTTSHAGFHSLTRNRNPRPLLCKVNLITGPPGKSLTIGCADAFLFCHWSHILAWSLLYSLNNIQEYFPVATQKSTSSEEIVSLYVKVRSLI